MSRIGNALTGTLSGASTGLSIGLAGAAGQGAIFGASAGPIGAGIGAIVGLAAGLFSGGGSSSGGGAGIKPKKFKDAARLQNDITLESLKRDAALAIQAEEKAARLYDDLRDAQYEQDLKNYAIAVEQREEAYKLARDAYEESVDIFDETVELNDISATMAMNDANRVFNQRRQSINEQGQLLKLQLFSAGRDNQITNDLIKSQMAASIKDARLNSRGVNTNLRSAYRDGSDAIKQSTRSFESATALANYDLQIKQIQLGADKKMIKSEMATLKGEKNAIIDSAKLQEKDILTSLDNAIAETDFAQQELALAQDERYAESAIQTDQLRRQGLLEQGAQLAKGQAGRSAAKSIQGLAFSNQQAQALIASALVRADSKHVIDKAKLAQSLKFTRQQGKSQLKETAIGLRRSQSEFAAAGLRMQAKRAEFGARAVEQKAVVEQLEEQGRQTTYQSQKLAKDLNVAKSLAQIDLNRLNNQVLASQEQMIGEITKNNNRLFDLRSQANVTYESMAFAGKSLDDELKINKERIEFDKMLANRAAESQVLDEPILPDLLPPPIKAPDLVRQPLPDIDWKKIEKSMDKARKAGQSYNPGGMSEFQTLMASITSIGEQAANIASAFAGPQQTKTQQAQNLIPLNYNQVNSNPFLTNNSLPQFSDVAPLTQVDPNVWNQTASSLNSTFSPTIDYSTPVLKWSE